ncbi:MAG: phosphoribosylglycinamide formyltransferase [Calditrichia bacterium]
MLHKIAVFASGRGSNFQAVYKKIQSGDIRAKISLLITNKSGAGAIDFARAHDIDVAVIPPGKFESPTAFGKAVLASLAEHRIQLIVLAGYLRKIPENVICAYPNKIINVHPSLLPAFGGKGMYGMNVHQAVFTSGVKVSGITVHFVDNKYDTGPILMQRAVDISSCGSPEEIAAVVLQEEHRSLPEAVKLLTERKIDVEDKRVLVGDDNR